MIRMDGMGMNRVNYSGMSRGNELQRYFHRFRANIIGQEQCFDTAFGRRRMLYADWTASGRAYRPIEVRLQEEILPFFGNTHTETTVTGTRMTRAYEQAKRVIRDHVRAGEEDQLLFCGSGMTAAVNKLQRILGFRVPERFAAAISGPALPEEERPLVLVTHMEHHSNHTSWLETIATVEVIRPDDCGNVDLGHLRELLESYRRRKVKIAAVTACSNVTGIETPYREIARIMHGCGGKCFVDFSCAAPYVEIDMHPGRKGGDGGGRVGGDDGDGRGVENGGDLDAIYFSMHKFLGGPGTPGVLVFDRKLYCNKVPDHPGGGTLVYSNPWGGREYVEDIEAREDGGTPPILQGIKAGFCIGLKEEMGMARMRRREEQLVTLLLDRLSAIPGVDILAADQRNRLGVVSFVAPNAHHDVIVRLLNDRFGIQARGGCSCAGTYGHFLLGIGRARSAAIREALLAGDSGSKPGWVRLSLHPTMTDEEVDYLAAAVTTVAKGITCPDDRI
jgi:selenocysteine lyase/cysteine desulfurase